MRTATLVLVLSVVTAAPSAAGKWSANVGFGTTFPVSTGGRISAVSPFGIEVAGSMGVLPEAYVSAINDVVISLGGYDEVTADVIEQSLDTSMVTTVSLGLPLAGGVKIRGGYGLVSLGGSSTLADAVAVASDAALPPELAGVTVDASATLHLFIVELGGAVSLTRHLGMNLGIGGAFTLEAVSNIDAEVPGVPSQTVSAFAAEGEAYLRDLFLSYGNTPILSMYFHYSF
jgi:hypothetical protein